MTRVILDEPIGYLSCTNPRSESTVLIIGSSILNGSNDRPLEAKQ
jgi:hypothetical protein